MVKNAIKIYGRIKPVTKRKDVGQYFIQEGNKEDTLFLQVREREYHEEQHHKTELSQFKFYKVFDQHVRQHEIFSSVAKPIVDSVLQGYNGTVFAYGQTGSGKTFTITGGPNDFEDRGLIPRAIEYVFRKIASADGSLYTVCVTYLQIYNEAAYDLLGHHQRMARLEDLPKLNLLDDTEGYLHIRNLSLHPVNSENEALNLLFLGDTNRAIAETPMNQASSRSHCMFTIHLAIRRTSWKNTRRAKLHFVDLAGSERLNKKGGRNTAGIDGRTINEARHINLSLHYLEQVITALAEAKRVHVPYRNCIITTMLRDSIGGNCLTSMVATLSLDHHHLPETLATCRFAQRVALVKNEATLNEDRDPMQEVSVLKAEVKRLKDQIRLFTNDKHYSDGHLTTAEETECRELVKAFLNNSQGLQLPMDLRKIEFCCYLLKEAVLEARRGGGGLGGANNPVKHERGSQHVEKCMQKLLQQRNNEIAILTELLRKERKHRMNSKSPRRTLSPPVSKANFDEYQKIIRHVGASFTKQEQAALKKFAANPAHTSEVDNLKAQLSIRHTAAKKIHDKIEENKARIVESRKMLAKLENGIPVSANVASRQKQLHAELKGILETEQSKYCSNLGFLRDLKNECDHLSHSIKQAEVRFLHNFQCWLAVQKQAATVQKHTPPQEIPQKLVENPRRHVSGLSLQENIKEDYNTLENLRTHVSTDDAFDMRSYSFNQQVEYNSLPNKTSTNINCSSSLSYSSSSPRASKQETNRAGTSTGVSGLKLQCLNGETLGEYFTCAELSFDDLQNTENPEGHQSKAYHKEHDDLDMFSSTTRRDQGISNNGKEDYNDWFSHLLTNDSFLYAPPKTSNVSEPVCHDFSEHSLHPLGGTYTYTENYGATGDYQREEAGENVYKRNLFTPLQSSENILQIPTSSKADEQEISRYLSSDQYSFSGEKISSASPTTTSRGNHTPPGTPPFLLNEKAKSESYFGQYHQYNASQKDSYNALHKTPFTDFYQFCETGKDARQHPSDSHTSIELIPQSYYHDSESKIEPDLVTKYYSPIRNNTSQQKMLGNPNRELEINSCFHNPESFLDSSKNKTQEEEEVLGSSASLDINLTKVESASSREENNSGISLKDIPLTGDKEVDEEIIAFYEAKQKALQKQNA